MKILKQTLPLTFAFAGLLIQMIAAPLQTGAEKETASQWVDRNQEEIIQASQRLWDLAELALKEHQSAEILARMLEEGGFRVERGVSNMPTAFVAEYGSGESRARAAPVA